jgi:mannosyl-oligosaccharide alpha-1,2-mannosidase
MAALNYQQTDPAADTTSLASDTAPTPTPNACALPAGQQDQAAFYQKNGFYITDSNYDLRPEVLESYYYAYRITGDPKYQEWAWDAFVHINRTARPPNGSGFSSFRDVNDPTGGGYGDNQESFLFAEVMKYAYLIFSEDGEWQVNYRGNGINKFVFNTEAHPFRVVRPPW